MSRDAVTIRWAGIVGLGLVACLPPLPEAESEADATGTTAPGATATGMLPDTDDAADDTGTGSDPAACGVLSPLVAQDDGLSVGNCHVHTSFDASDAVGMTSLRAAAGSDTELLYADESEPIERYAGVLLNPAHAAWAGQVPPSDEYAVEVWQSGPAVHRVRVPWEHVIPPGNGVSGESVFTVLADGRIFRDERVLVDQPDLGDWLVAYVALRATALSVVRWGGAATGQREVLATDNGGLDIYYDQPQDVFLCAHDAGSGDTVGWVQYEGTYTQWAGPRASWHQGIAGIEETTAVALQADWVRDMAVESTEYEGEVMLHVGATKDADPCAATHSYYLSYRDPGAVVIQAGGTVVDTERIGDEHEGDGFSHGGGFYYLAADGTGPLRLSIAQGASVHRSVLLHVANLEADAVSAVSVDGRGLSADEYLVQPAYPEFGGGTWGLDTGAFVLIGVSVQRDAPIVIAY